MAFKEYARSQSRCEPMVGKPEVIAWVLVNALTGQVKSAKIRMSGYPTYQELLAGQKAENFAKQAA